MPVYHCAPASRPSRRRFLQLMGHVAPMALLAACTVPVTSVDNASTVTPPATGKTLIFWGDENHPLALAVEGFMAAHPEIEWVAPHPADHAAKMKKALAAGADLPDLYWSEAPFVQAWGCEEVLTDLTEHLKPVLTHYHPAKLAESYVVQQNQYVGWPGDLGLCGWYYRQDKLQALGWQAAELAALTWPAFIEMTATLRAQGFYTYCFPPNGWSPLFFLLLHQVGGTALRKDGKRIMLGGEKGIQAMRLLKQLWEAGGGLAVDWQQPAYWTALKEGRLLGDFAPAWARPAWEANLKANETAAVVGEWRVAPLPGGDGIAHRTGVWGGGQLVTPKAAANPAGALLFMQYALASIEGADLVSASGVVPAYRPFLASTRFAAQRSPLFGDWAFGQFWAAQEQELSTAYFRPAGWAGVRTAVEQEMMAILNDTYAIEDGMSRIVERALPAFQPSQCK